LYKLTNFAVIQARNCEIIPAKYGKVTGSAGKFFLVDFIQGKRFNPDIFAPISESQCKANNGSL